jgi:hypothetical protein
MAFPMLEMELQIHGGRWQERNEERGGGCESVTQFKGEYERGVDRVQKIPPSQSDYCLLKVTWIAKISGRSGCGESAKTSVLCPGFGRRV